VARSSCQFGGDGYTPFKKGRKVKRGELVPLRFLIFAAKVHEQLKTEKLVYKRIIWGIMARDDRFFIL
jgi:hypothetical protein